MRGQTARLLYEAPFMGMVGEFSTWRIDQFIRQTEAIKQKGRILPFVRGLFLSSRLIYIIREILSGTRLTANWGHILDNEGNFCSCECDVIIHHEGEFKRWNGNERPVMDFRFIEQEQVIAVISCKSHLESGHIDKEYCDSMRAFINKIWLFAECCPPRAIKNIRSKALRCGYEKFFYLYTWNKDIAPQPNANGLNEFVEEVRKLKG